MTAPSHSLGQRIWRSFRADRRACAGLFLVALLFVVGVFSPFLANSLPILMVTADGTVWSPLLRTFTASDWRYLLLPLGGLALFLNRRRLSRRSILLAAVAWLIAVETFAAWWRPFNDTTDYRSVPALIKIIPPISYSPYEISADVFAPPSLEHLCGTDSLGRDIASRMVHGTRISLTIGFVSAGIAIFIGTALGMIAGYYKRWIDMSVSRLVEIMECFPTFFLIISIIAFLPRPDLFTIMAVIGITSWAGVARLVRGEFLKLSVQPFTLAAQASGAGDARVILRHLLPNAMGPILVAATFGVAAAILVEASLSFLGFGVPPPTPTWGDTLSEARRYLDFAWWLAFFPGCAIFLTITSYNLVGEGLRDAIDPRLRT